MLTLHTIDKDTGKLFVRDSIFVPVVDGNGRRYYVFLYQGKLVFVNEWQSERRKFILLLETGPTISLLNWDREPAEVAVAPVEKNFELKYLDWDGNFGQVRFV